MRDLSEFLTEREIYIIKNHPAISYAELGMIFGITSERVRQLKIKAERSIREEKRREQEEIAGQKPVKVTLAVKDLYLLIRLLDRFVMKARMSETKNSRKTYGPDPDLRAAEMLLWRLRERLTETES